MTRFLWLMLCAALAACGGGAPSALEPSSGVTYYVSPSGDDANPGSMSARPWRSVAKVNATTFGPGDRILFEGGQSFAGNLYFDASDRGSAANPIVVGSYGSGRATIQAGASYGLFAYNTGGFRVERLVFRGSGLPSNRSAGVLFYTDLTNAKFSGVTLDRLEVRGFLDGGVLIGADKKGSGYQNVRITQVSAHSNGDSGIQLFGYFGPDAVGYANSDVYIGYSRAYNNPGKVGKGNNTGSGVVLGSVDRGTVEYSLAYNNGALNDFVEGGPVGIWAYDANAVTIQFNEAYANKTGTGKDGGGFDLDGAVTNSVMQYNYSHDNDGPGYLLAQYEGARPFSNNVVRYNISENDGRKNDYAGIYLFAAPGDRLSNTSIYNNTVFVSPAPSGRAAAFRVLEGGMSNVRVYNNIFLTTGGVPLVDSPVTSGLAFRGNAYWPSGGSFVIRWGNKTYGSLSAWRSGAGQETLGGSAVGVQAAPRLNAPGNGGTIGDATKLAGLSAYKLRADSPMRDAGLDLWARFGVNSGPRDFYGTALPQNGAYDIGAHEYR